MKSQMMVPLSCANLDSLCIVSKQGKMQAKPSNISISHEFIVRFCILNVAIAFNHFHH
jgi:hypothetical protein